MNILNNKREITQSSMIGLLGLRDKHKKLEVEISEMENAFKEELKAGRKPSKGRLLCLLKNCSKTNVKWKDETIKRVNKEELGEIIKTASISYWDKVEIKPAI